MQEQNSRSPDLNLTNQKVLIVGGGSRMGLEVAKLTATLANSAESPHRPFRRCWDG